MSVLCEKCGLVHTDLEAEGSVCQRSSCGAALPRATSADTSPPGPREARSSEPRSARWPLILGAVAVFCLAAAYVLYPFARAEARIPLVGELRIDRAQAADVLEGLLTNVYRCFDIHNEDLIYDRLALTVTGEQLLDVYLESRRALELENRGGARVRIDEVVVREIRAIRETEDGGYELDTLWTVGGSVNHFGHIHFRQNRYDATITIVPVDGTWKILGLELIEEKRVL